jgi:F-type H+-transporting ATPase subunit b
MEEAKRIEGHKSEMEKIRVEKLKEIDREAGIFLERAKETAEKMKGEILSAAEKEAAELLAKGRRQLADERARVLNEVQAMLTKIILEMTEKILQREFSADDEKRLVSHLTKDLPQLLR